MLADANIVYMAQAKWEKIFGRQDGYHGKFFWLPTWFEEFWSKMLANANIVYSDQVIWEKFFGCQHDLSNCTTYAESTYGSLKNWPSETRQHHVENQPQPPTNGLTLSFYCGEISFSRKLEFQNCNISNSKITNSLSSTTRKKCSVPS